MPLVLLVVISLVTAAYTLMFANELLEPAATVARAAGLLLVVGPPVAVFYLGSATTVTADSGPEGSGTVACGSALSAALIRPYPGTVLDSARRRCGDDGRRAVVVATGYALATTAVSIGLVTHAVAPVWRRQRAAAA